MAKQIKLPTLLVVTDNPSIRFWVKKHLDEQFFVISAENRREAIGAMNARLDFIILDEEMEEALELSSDLSKLSKNNLVPILLITGRLKKSFRDKAKKRGVTDFLSNQLDVEELKIRIEEGLKSACARQRTENLGSLIKVPKMGNSTLKDKFVLTPQALELIASAKNDHVPVSLLLLRVDQKETLDPLAQFINRFIQANDVIIPSSEGKFIILLYNVESAKAKLLAEKLQEAIKKQTFELPTGPAQITVSIVVSALEASEQGFTKMIDSAFKSLKTHSETSLILPLDEENL